MELFFRKYGESPKAIVIFHGLFGSSDNWLTQAKLLSENFTVYLVDQRNHGLSPKSNDFDYDLLAGDIKDFLMAHDLKGSILLGHSMGGKAVMRFALAYPDWCRSIIIADIAPKQYDPMHDHIIEGLTAIPIDSISSRNEADQYLSNFVPQAGVRQFLLKNLQRKDSGGFQWKINLPVLERSIEKISGGFSAQIASNYENPCLFIRGSKSDYVLDDDMPTIESLFPNYELKTLPAGHWVQAEVPDLFVEAVMSFISEHAL